MSSSSIELGLGAGGETSLSYNGVRSLRSRFGIFAKRGDPVLVLDGKSLGFVNNKENILIRINNGELDVETVVGSKQKLFEAPKV